MSRKRLLGILCAIALLVTIIPVDIAEAAARSNTLTLSETSYVMKKGARLRLKVTGSLIGFNGRLKWSTSNWKVAVVTPRGVVIARKKGTTVIKVKAGGQKATCKITVGTPVKKIKASKKSLTLKVGKTAKLKTGISPKTATVKKLKYTTKNKRVATVSKKGVVKGIAAGSTQVTVQSTDGSGKAAKIKVKVQGKKKSKQPINLTVKPVINVILPTPAPGQNASDTVAATGISLSDARKQLNINEEAQLTATVTPANATDKTVKWASANTEIATVSKTGLVTPQGEGEVEITASTADGKHSAKCIVSVTPTAVVSTDKEIAHALTKKNLKRLEIESSTSKMLTVPEGTYSNVEMVVNLPNGELENHGVFQGIRIEEIAKDTYFEKAIGNIIEVASKKAHVVIDEKADASIILAKENKDISIENNGIIKKLEINTKGNVEISGLSKEKIAVDIKAEVTISSTLKLDINATSRFDITVRPGAESTAITVDVEANMPGIFGMGMIAVKITATGEIKNVISENKGEDDLAGTVKITGSVRSAEDGELMEGVQIYIARYTGNEYDVENIWSDRDAVRLTTDAKGGYTTNNKVKAGNYYLAARKDGFMDLTRQIVVISSNQGDAYINEEIKMIPADWAGKKGNVTGKVLDSVEKDLELKDIAVRLKKGKGNMASEEEILKETRTDAAGEYRFDDLEVGHYTIEFTDDKTQAVGGEAYLTAWINVLIRPDETVVEGVMMTKSLQEKQMRVVLRWGSEESGAVADLDAHLTGPMGYDGSADNDRFHIYFQNMKFDNGKEEGRSHAYLDVDDMDYVGPETATVYERIPGVYSYYIHDYTNRGSQESDKLSNSSVKVDVYVDDLNVKQNTYYISQKPGTVWHVFDYDSNTGKFKTVNTMYYETESAYVGNTVSQYKLSISQDLRYIEEYQQSLEEGTGADISEKIAAYRQRLDALTEGQEEEAARLRYETNRYEQELYYECDLSCKGVGKSSNLREGNVFFHINSPEIEVTAADVQGPEGVGVTEVTPTKEGAWKAFRVVAKSGHIRTIHVYLEWELGMRSAKVGEEELILLSGNEQTDGQGEKKQCLYVYSKAGTEFALSDIQFTYTTDEKNVTRDSKKIDGEYCITMQSDSETKTWIIRKLTDLQITDPENKIYKMHCSGSSINVYAEQKLLSKGCVLSVNGQQYELTKDKSGPNYTSYRVFVEKNLNLWINCYAIEDVCTLQDAHFNNYVESSVDQEAKTVTVTAMDERVKAEDLSLSWANTLFGQNDVKKSYEAVTGEDYIGKITVTVDGVSDYANEYKVYFEPYQPPAD